MNVQKSNNTKKSMVLMLVILLLVIAGAVYAIQGITMHTRVGVEEARFHELQAEYFIVSKTERDAAPTGSELNQQLVEIQNFPSELLRLKLVGVGKILTGIFLSLLAILIALAAMPTRLGALLAKKNQDIRYTQ